MKEKGFTLIEILLAVLILAVVLTTVYASYTGTFRLIDETETDAEIYGMARCALKRMTLDIEAVARWKESFVFAATENQRGESDFTALEFRSGAHVAFGTNEPPAGVATIRYTVEKTDEEGGFALYRSDSLSIDPARDDAPPLKYMLCDRIENVTYTFYDEKGEKHETWNSIDGPEAQRKKAPAIVEIRLFLVNEKNPDSPHLFMTAVRVRLVGTS